MNDHTPHPSDTTPDPTATAWAERLLRRQAERLEQLSESGLRLAQAIERTVTEADEPAAPNEAAMAFSRVARAVRMTDLLQTRLIQDLGRLKSWAELEAKQASEAAEAQAKAAKLRSDPAYGHKARVEAIVARVVRAETDNRDRIERLIRETGERLDDDDIYGDVSERPVGELVSLLCRDLGLKPDWKRLGEEAWALAEADNPRSPFAGLTENAASPARGGGGPLAEERVVERESHRQTPAAAWFGDSS